MIQEINSLAENHIPFLLIVDFEMKKPRLFPMGSLPLDIMVKTPAFRSHENQPPALPGQIEFYAEAVNYEKYFEAFQHVIDKARAGRTYLANLTFPSTLRTNLSLNDIYHLSQAKYKLLYKNEFVVFSPETFVRIKAGKIYSYPMKGTIDAAIPGAKDLILNDVKEMAEHVTIVDLIRNDLSIHAHHVRVEKFRYIESLETNHKKLLQVSSVISGQLPENYYTNLGEIIFSMLPAGSVSGAPKKETLRIIRESEGSPRGYYTGILVYFDGWDLDSAVMIRFIEEHKGRMIYHSGGGITFMSDPEKEYQELKDKIYVPFA